MAAIIVIAAIISLGIASLVCGTQTDTHSRTYYESTSGDWSVANTIF